METTFYDDNNVSVKKMKTNMTLDLSTMNKLKQDRLTDVLQTPDMGLFMISTPELERLIVHNNHNNTVLTTPTPTGQILFPKMVTEEQEAYARGFIDALGELHKNNKPQQPQQPQSQLQQQSQQQQRPQSQPQQSVVKPQTPQLQNVVTSSTATSTAASSFIPTTFNNILTYNNTSNFDPIIENEIIFSEPLNMKTMNPTTVSNMFDYNNNNISTMNNYSNNSSNSNSNVIVTSNINTMLKPAVNSLSTTTTSLTNNNNNTKLMYNNPMIHQLQQQKEIYQTVPHSPANSKNNSSSSSSPNHYAQTNQISPINMDVQEVAKLERKRARNRIAATRCRNRKLERIARLEERVKELKDQNLNLAQSASLLREQVFKLKQTIVEHTQRGCQVMLTSKFLDSNTMFS